MLKGVFLFQNWDMEVKDGSLIVVWFSCGAASAVAAKKTIGCMVTGVG